MCELSACASLPGAQSRLAWSKEVLLPALATAAWQTNGMASSLLAGAAREPLLAHELRIGATGAGATSSGAVARLAGGLFRRCAAT